MPALRQLFARRYLFSPKSLSVINLIAKVSLFAVGVPVAAMVVLLSVFNGFGGMVRDLYDAAGPDLLVGPASGKTFVIDSLPRERLRSVEGVAGLSWMLEGDALIEYRGRQATVTLRGVDEEYTRLVPLDSAIVAGSWSLRFGDIEQAVVGEGVAYSLGVRTAFYDAIRVYVPSRGTYSSLLPAANFRTGGLLPGGIYRLNAQLDGRYVYVPLDFMQRVAQYPGRATHLLVGLNPGVDARRAAEAVRQMLGERYTVLTREEQNASLMHLMRFEKWAIFFIALLVLVVASCSVVGTLAMLMIDKRDDCRTLAALGADLGMLRGIFVREGMLITAIGTAGGLCVGLLLCLGQQYFGWIRIGAETMLTDVYPVRVVVTDFVGIVVAALAVNYPIVLTTVRAGLRASVLRYGQNEI